MQQPVIFDFSDYKPYLAAAMDDRRQREKGVQARLAEAVGCQSAYLSMVLKGSAHLSLEQAERVNGFIGHGRAESHYMLLLVQRARAGSDSLRRYFDTQLRTALSERQDLTRRLDYQTILSDEQRGIFYSSWHYVAVHMALTIPRLSTPEAIAEYLRLPLATVRQTLAFLIQVGLVKEDKVLGRLELGAVRLHLPAESPFIAGSHIMMRQQAIASLQRPSPDDFHYTSTISASRRDLPRLREIMVRCIEQMRGVIQESPEEDLFCYSMDIFGMKSC